MGKFKIFMAFLCASHLGAFFYGKNLFSKNYGFSKNLFFLYFCFHQFSSHMYFFGRMFFMAKTKQYVLQNKLGNRYSTITTFVCLQYCIGPNTAVLLKNLMPVNQFQKQECNSWQILVLYCRWLLASDLTNGENFDGYQSIPKIQHCNS